MQRFEEEGRFLLVPGEEITASHDNYPVHIHAINIFYASSGVTLSNVVRGKGQYRIDIETQPGVTYTTQFMSTRKQGGESRRSTTEDHRQSRDLRISRR
ncbi:MAG: hypothetical protein GY930_02030 [bacterium]|nr:hypothetical protein [bacterium]